MMPGGTPREDQEYQKLHGLGGTPGHGEFQKLHGLGGTPRQTEGFQKSHGPGDTPGEGEGVQKLYGPQGTRGEGRGGGGRRGLRSKEKTEPSLEDEEKLTRPMRGTREAKERKEEVRTGQERPGLAQEKPQDNPGKAMRGQQSPKRSKGEAKRSQEYAGSAKRGQGET